LGNSKHGFSVAIAPITQLLRPVTGDYFNKEKHGFPLSINIPLGFLADYSVVAKKHKPTGKMECFPRTV